MEIMFGIIIGLLVTVCVLALIGSMIELHEKIEKVELDLEIIQTERDYFKDELEKHKAWAEFLPGQVAESDPTDKPKFDPNEVPGAFDGIFDSLKAE